MMEEEAPQMTQPWALPPGLSADALEYLHEDEHFRINAPEVWQRYKGYINKSMSLSNLSPQDELILFDLLDIQAVSMGFYKRAKDVTAADLNDNDNGYALSLAHVSVGRAGFGRKLIMTQIRVVQQPQQKQPSFIDRHFRGK